MERFSIFISYSSHTSEDKKWRDRLIAQLKALGKDNVDPVWDEQIKPGQEWDLEIQKMMDKASLAILLISADFLTSDYIQDNEIPRLLSRNKDDAFRILPLIVRPCNWKKYSWLNALQVRPEGETPLSTMSTEDQSEQHLAEFANEIANIIGKIPQKQMYFNPPVSNIEQKKAAPVLKPNKFTSRYRCHEPEMILIPAGEFLMGSDSNIDRNATPDELPRHNVFLQNYYIGKIPVTNQQYTWFVSEKNYDIPDHWEREEAPTGIADHPVVNVSWYDAIEYCQWLSEITGKEFFLPSEAEWEKGARGNDGRIYPWGNRWKSNFCNIRTEGKEKTTDVNKFTRGKSPYGLLDMAGNVREWTRSLWGESMNSLEYKYPYDPNDDREQVDAPDNILRISRGGCFCASRELTRCAARERHSPRESRRIDLGFRLAAYCI